ncbi:MAG: tetratricopeptide repeat protein [Spirochaetales bacterium]|nr:tetratricopeptide repeat protein [Spirochaetales bacterium]
MVKKWLFSTFLVFILVNISAQTMSPVELYNQGALLEADGDLYKAYDFYQRSLQLNPYYIEPLLGLTVILFKMQQYDQALEFVDRAIALDPNDCEIENLKARILIGLGQFSDAEQLFEKVLSDNPNNLHARLGLADLQAIYGSYSSAINSYNSILNAYPENARALMAIILVYDNIKNFQEADRYIKRAIAAYPNNSYIRMLAARHYRTNGSYLIAENQAKFALKISQNKVEPVLLLSKIYLEQGLYYQALELLLSYETIEDLDILYLTAYVYGKLENYSKAVLYYKKVLALNPGDEISRIMLEETVRLHTDFSSEPRNELANYHFKLAKEFQERSFYQKSFIANRRGLSLLPNSRLGIEGLATYYNVNNYFSRYYQKIIDLNAIDPENIHYKDILEIYEPRVKNFVSTRWNIDQFLLNRDSVRVSMFFIIKKLDDSPHFDSSSLLLEYFRHVFTGYEGAKIVNSVHSVSDYSEALRLAQEGGSEYFFILDFSEDKRVFYSSMDIYFSSSGILLKSLVTSSAGNNRVIDSFSILTRDFFSLMPVRGSILSVNFEKALINLGKVDGLKVGDKLNIIRRDSLSLKGRGFDFDYPEEALVGELEIIAVDDLVAEARIIKKLHYDFVNERDFVILEKEAKDPASASVKRQTNSNFLKDILKIY